MKFMLTNACRVVVTVFAGCSSPSVAPAPAYPPLPARARPIAVRLPWSVAVDGEVLGLDGATMFEWDSLGYGGIAERSAIDGILLRTRRIARLNINGAPRFWEAVPGGYLAQWDAPMAIRDGEDGVLSVAWAWPTSDSWIEHAVFGESLIAAVGHNQSSLARIALADGHEVWRVPLSLWSDGIEIALDDRFVYVTLTEYVTTAPTPTIAIPRRVLAFDLATGMKVWNLDFATAPQQLVVSRGTVVATEGPDLVFFDGQTSQVRARVTLANRDLDPKLVVAGDTLYAAYDKALSAFALETGNRRWSTSLSLDNGPELVALGDLVIVTTAAGSVAALDRASGALQWDIGVGLTGSRLRANPTAVVVSDRSWAAGFGLPPTAPVERAVIHGRVVAVGCGALANAELTIAGRRIEVADDGAFRTTIEARGIVLVRGRQQLHDVPPPGVHSAIIKLAGRGDYGVPDLTLSNCTSF